MVCANCTLLRAQVAAGIVGEQAREDQQAVERRAQLVRHVGEELRFRLARALGGHLGADELGLDPVALGEVAHHLGVAEQLPGVVAHRRDDHVAPVGRAVLAHAPAFLLEAPLGGGHLQLPLRLPALDVLARVEAREMLSQDLLRLVAGDALGARVPARDAAFGVEHENRVVDDAFDHEPEAPLAVGEHALGARARGDVLVQQAVRLLEIPRALAHAQLELPAARAQLGQRLLELAEQRAQDEAGEDHRDDEEQEQHQRRVERPRSKGARLAAQGVPQRDRADRRDGGGHFALAETESGPDDERHDQERGGVGGAAAGRAAAKDGVRDEKQESGDAAPSAMRPAVQRMRPGAAQERTA